MKYIGNKTKLIDFINEGVELTGLNNGVFFDAFSGTCSVGKFFKRKGFNIISNDLMFYSYVEQKAYIENNNIPEFNNLLTKINIKKSKNILESVIEYLNSLEGIEGFIYKNYSPEGSGKFSDFKRQYFTDYNAKKIDAVRLEIENWRNKKHITEYEFFILLSFLINEADYLSNTSGTYGAFLKIWRSVAINKFNLRKKDLILGDKKHFSYNKNTNDLIKELKEVDITYFDIPYNQRQYSSNFHILETIALYDNPVIKGISGIRADSSNKSSNYCKKKLVYEEVYDLIRNIKTKYILFSYSSDGLLKFDEIKEILDKNGTKIDILKKEYRRFKTDNSRKYKNSDNELLEYLFVYKK